MGRYRDFFVVMALAAISSLRFSALSAPLDGNAPVDPAPPIRASNGPNSSIPLSESEQAWVREHPAIRVAATQDWPPFEFVNADGIYTGISADLLTELCRRTGLEVEYVTGPWPELYKMLRNHELDVCPGMGVSPDRKREFLFTKPLWRFPHAIYVQSENLDIADLDGLAGKVVSVESGYYTQEILQSEYPEIRLSKFSNALQALLAVDNGDADAYIGNTAVSSYVIDRNVITGLKPVWCAELDSFQLSIGVRADYAPLVEILNRAIDSLTAPEIRAIIAKYAVVPQWVELTEAEQNWIEAHPAIRLGIDPEFAPFEFVAEDGSYQGMASDYIDLLNQRLGIALQVVHDRSWEEASSLAMAHELDVLPCVATTEERAERFLFTDPYLSFYRVAVTRVDAPLVAGIGDLAKMRVAVQANSSHHGFLVENSSLSPVLFDTVQDTLAAVSRGEVDAAVGNVATITYWIRKLGLTNIRIAAPVDQGENTLHFAVRNDWPELVSILNKGLASITEEEAHAIRQKWVGVSVEPGLSPQRVLRYTVAAVAAALFFFLLFGLHNHRLRKEIRSRRAAEAARNQTESDYRTLVESANSVILRMKTDGTVTFINAFGERFFGFPSGELLGKKILDTIVPESESQGRDLRALMEDLARDPDRYVINENENITRSGERVWVAWTNRPLYGPKGNIEEILCVGSDMTARKRAESILFRYEFIVNTVDDMMSVIDSDGRYEVVNSAWCAAMSMERQNVIGKSISEVWPPEAAQNHIWPDLGRCLNGEVVSYESTVEFPARGERSCEVTMYPCADASGRVTHALVVTHDVTDWRTAQAALKEAKQSAEAANRAKSTFLANMSHEIRTPMNAILGYTQLLRRELGQYPDQRHALEAIGRSGDHLLTLIDDVLEMSRIEAGRIELHPSTFNFHALLHDLETMFRVRTNGKGVELVTDIDSNVPQYVVADESRVRQILVNLVGNAVKFTDRGRITIRASAITRAQNGEVTLDIDVEDTGCGIDPGDWDAIFESFEQAGPTAQRRGGTGLGLPISRSFARLMDGDITVSSEPGKGSRFQFEMRAGIGDPSLVESRDSACFVKRLRPRYGEQRVLVIDDRQTNRDLLCRLLEKVGFNTRAAEDGERGVRAFVDWKPQIVLVDLVMPVMNGRDAIGKMRAAQSGRPACIIAVTASTLEDERAAVLAQGADAFLRKPFRENDLFELIRIHGNVEFDYEDEVVETTGPDPVASADLARRALRHLPVGVRHKLRNAIVTGSIDEAYAIAEDVRESAPGLAALISQRAEEFALHNLEALFPDEEDDQ
ncbi:MAG: hypothetical protein AMXMBFR82_48600 [Candidatus Hydrogenedentota bacterium]